LPHKSTEWFQQANTSFPYDPAIRLRENVVVPHFFSIPSFRSG
jgi:hypothetical protein